MIVEGFVGEADWITLHFQTAGIEALSQKIGLAHEQQVSGREQCVGIGANQQAALCSRTAQSTEVDAAKLFRSGMASREINEVIAIREELRPAMRAVFGEIDGGDSDRRSPGRRHLEKATPNVRREQQHAFCAP